MAKKKQKEKTIKIEVVEDGVIKVIEIVPEYVGKDGQPHVSHVNANRARGKDQGIEQPKVGRIERE